MKNILLCCLVLFCIGSLTAQPVFERQLLQDSSGSTIKHFQIDYDNDGDEDLLVYVGYTTSYANYNCTSQLKWWENDNNSLNYRGISFCYNGSMVGTTVWRTFLAAKIYNGIDDELAIKTTGIISVSYSTNYHDISTDTTIKASFSINPGYQFTDVRLEEYNFVDLNNDGYDDVFKHNPDDKYRYYLNRQDGTFATVDTALFGVPIYYNGDGFLEFQSDSIIFPTTDFRFFDLDGNGTEDWVFQANGDRKMYWLSNTGDTNFQNLQLLQTFNDSLAENWFKDLDGDGDLDLIANIKDEGLKSYSNDGAGNFTYDKQIYPSNSALFEVADLDDDGYLDIVISPEIQNPDSTITHKTIWLNNNSNLNYTEFLIDNREITECRFAYVNGDDRLDIVDFSIWYELNYYANSSSIDTIPPSIICKDSIVALEYGDSIIIPPSELIVSATDNDIIESIESSQTVFYALDIECYSVEITATDYSGNEAVCTSQVCIDITTTSRNQNFGVSISVFPNPASNYVQINLSKKLPFKYDVSIIDLSGRIISESKNVDDSNIQLDCSNLSKGIYMINLTNSIDKSVIFNESIVIQ